MKNYIVSILLGLALFLCAPFQVSAASFTISNGSLNNLPVNPLSSPQSAADYYSYGGWGIAPYGDPAFGTQSNTGFFWLYEDSRNGNISLCMIFDAPFDGSRGQLELLISGMPATSFWEVEDDPGEQHSPTNPDWHWDANGADGGVIGGLNDLWEITIMVDFVEGIDTWYFLNGPNPTLPARIELDMGRLKSLSINAVSEPLNVSLDIKPQSCPNPLNTKSKGVLPVAILGTIDFDVTQIDVSTVTLEGVAPIRSDLEDVAAPFNGLLIDDCFDCTQEGADGLTDLTLKFDTQEVVAALGDVDGGGCIQLTITGELTDGTPIEGTDSIVIVPKPQTDQLHPTKYEIVVTYYTDEEEGDWIELELKDRKGNPVSGDYVLILPDGEERTGSTDENGYAREEDVEPGTVTLEFPGLNFRKRIEISLL